MPFVHCTFCKPTTEIGEDITDALTGFPASLPKIAAASAASSQYECADLRVAAAGPRRQHRPKRRLRRNDVALADAQGRTSNARLWGSLARQCVFGAHVGARGLGSRPM